MFFKKGNYKKMALLLCFSLIMSTLTACAQEQEEVTFDASGYIQAYLDNSYRGENEDYMAAAGATTEEVTSIYEATVSNSVINFFEKYEINPDAAQEDRLTAIFQAALSQAIYTANPKEDTEDGYKVSVTYTPIITFQNIEVDIFNIKGEAGQTLYDVGAEFINQIIDLCETAAQNPQNGTTAVIEFNLKVDEEGKIFLDISTFDELDDLILVV